MKFLLLLLLSNSIFSNESVFRCNLDNHPRVLVFQSNDRACAYDTNTGQFWKAWKAPTNKIINFTGAVYDGRHGPQPNTIGVKLLENSQGLHWRVKQKRARYYSYSPIRKTITLRIYRQDKTYIAIIEQPIFTADTIYRSVTIEGLKNNEILTLGDQEFTENSTYKLEDK
ncbi:hypothetical protein PQO03_12190 [Lentisphaera profundi]|uniref:Uncharacterized protein n=1 Tax=Lentisphaera profundi TaxID=1658616 RepID=A0ABY7VWX7_9BACT|nr:hypothetical protein [Lentisphaera profundi]WDE98597.1 hypothetical protein PQO03_12190 [Lentisphaera profundi]